MDERQIEQLTEEALEALRTDDFVRAVAIADQLTAIVPDDAAVRAIRAEALVKADAGEDALAEARRAVELDPENHHLNAVLGLAAWQTERLTLAQQSFERAVELSGEKPRVVADLAFFMGAARGPRLAEAAANEALGGDPKCAAAWAALGLAQFRQRRRRAAEASLTQALELDPNEPYAQAAMLVLLHDRHDDTRALALAKLLDDSRPTEEFLAVRLFFRGCGLPAPGTEQLVETIQQNARKRQIARTLIERRAVREPTYYADSPHKTALLLFLVALMTTSLLVLLWFLWPFFN